MPEGTVFVGEDFDDDPFMWPGRFSAHWESPDGSDHEDGPRGVSAQEAIEWGRERADVVLIRPGDSDTHYSAGARQPDPVEDDDQDFPVWPEGEVVHRRRAAGHEYLDRSAGDPPIRWIVRLFYPPPAGDAPGFAECFTASLDRQPDVQEIEAEVRKGRWWSRWTRSRDPESDGPGAGFSFVVRASTHREAEELASAAVDRAFEEAASSSKGLRGSGLWFSRMDHVEPAPPPARRPEPRGSGRSPGGSRTSPG